MGEGQTTLDVLRAASNQDSVAEAIEWIANDHSLDSAVEPHDLLRALIELNVSYGEKEAAIRQVARRLARSDVDSAAVLFEPESIAPASRFRDALAVLARRCKDNSLKNITSNAVIAAQRDNKGVMEALCAVAGISFSELSSRVAELPAQPRSRWSPSQVREAFKLIESLVQDTLTSDLPGAVPARPIELMPKIGVADSGWSSVEAFRVDGVPYEGLLAQRAAGSGWLAHRNKTSSKLAPLIAEKLCEELDARSIGYLRAKSLGGDSPTARLAAKSESDKQVGLLVRDDNGDATFIVIFSVARDSGTASKNAGRLRTMKRPRELPAAVIVVGPGWESRNETADLAVAFSGRIYSDRTLRELAEEIEAVLIDRKDVPDGDD